MALTFLSVPATVSLIARRRPVLEPVLTSLGPLLEARDRAAAAVAENLRASGWSLPQFLPENARAGSALLAGASFAGFGAFARQAAQVVLPELAGQPAIAAHRQNLEQFFMNPANEPEHERVFEALVAGDDAALAKIAGESGLPPEVFGFAAEFVHAAVLRATVAQSTVEAPWDAEGAWSEGYCPVCGTYPSIGWLDRPRLEEKNAFLAGGGGKKHLHCPICGANWKFRRLVCPGCGQEGEGTMEILKETGSHGERLDCCAHCKSYCPTVDLRELADTPHMDAMALGMMHMDMAASKRQLHPLRASFWNIF